MELVHRSHESSIISADGTASVDQITIQKADVCRDTEGQERKYHVADLESDYDQMQERWYRDPFGRDNNQSVTKAVENQRNLEEAMYNEGFSQVRASKIAYYMTRCEGQLQEWDLVVKKQPRFKNRCLQEESILDLTTETVQGHLDCAIDDDGEEDEIDDGNSDRDGSKATSMVGGGRQRLRELKGTVSGRVSPAKRPRKPRSHKDERQKRRDRKAEALRIKEYTSYAYGDYLQAARRYDIVYGSAETLYQLAEDQKATCLIEGQRTRNRPTTEIMIDGHLIDVEDPTFGLTQPTEGEALTQEERRACDLQNKQLWTQKQKDILIRNLEKHDILHRNSMSQ
jgi:hypothetical protein